MSKQRQEDTYSDSADKKSLALSPIVTGRNNQEASTDAGISGRTIIDWQNRDEHLMQKLEKAKYSVRRVQLATLSKAVNKAFTGWTIKTQGSA